MCDGKVIARLQRAGVGLGAKRRLSDAGSQEQRLTAAEPLALQSPAFAAGGLGCGRRL